MLTPAALVAFLAGLSPGTPTLAEPPPPVEIVVEQVVTTPSQHDESIPLIARRIMWCESRFDNDASPGTSTASGYFQFLDGTWEWVTGLQPPASQWPYEVQFEAWQALWDDGQGAHHWAPSEHCWSNTAPWD